MRLNEVSIKNFRKLKDCTIKLRDTTFLIGPNNSGKSSVFAALQYLHKSTNVTREDYSKRYDETEDGYIYEDEITVTAEYHNLPDDANSWLGFRGRVISHQDALEGETNNKIIYKKVWALNQSKPKIYMLEYPRTKAETYRECIKVSDLVGDDFTEAFLKDFFGEGNYDKNLTAGPVKNKLLDIPQYWEIDNQQEATWVENPGGIPGNVISRLPRIVVIPAESCIAELTNSGGALFSLLGDLFEQVRNNSKNYEQAQVLLNSLANELNPNDADTDFGRLISELNGMVHDLFPESSVHVSASLDQPEKTIKPLFNVEMESNVKTAVDYQGHGMIRATAFQLLRFVQDFVNRGAHSPRSTIFCFEEPEIYLHPAAANQMRDALYELSGPTCQIVATTHSPYMINLGADKSMSLTKFSFDGDEFSISDSFNLEKAFSDLQADEKQNLKMLLKLDDYISRIFFTKKCIFVEGDTEEVVVRETIKRLQREDKARVIGNCELLRARGKAVLISIAKYLNALGINYILMHDRDAGTEKAEAMNQPILDQTGPERRVMIEECIEDILGYASPSNDKPYKAHKHIDDNWGEDLENVPEQWKQIFIKLCSPHLDHLSNP